MIGTNELVRAGILANLLMVALYGCNGCKPTPTKLPAATALHGVSMSEPVSRGYTDYFVTFTVSLSGDRMLTSQAEVRPWLYPDDPHVFFSDKMTQADGKEVEFDCDAIADKIIDGALVAEITPICPQLHAKGDAYWNSVGYMPRYFTDSTGTVWTRRMPHDPDPPQTRP